MAIVNVLCEISNGEQLIYLCTSTLLSLICACGWRTEDAVEMLVVVGGGRTRP